MFPSKINVYKQKSHLKNNSKEIIAFWSGPQNTDAS